MIKYQSSENKDVQSIIDHGFTVDKIEGNHCTAYFDGIGRSELQIFIELPELLWIENKGNDSVKLVFEITE